MGSYNCFVDYKNIGALGVPMVPNPNPSPHMSVLLMSFTEMVTNYYGRESVVGDGSLLISVDGC